MEGAFLKHLMAEYLLHLPVYGDLGCLHLHNFFFALEAKFFRLLRFL